MSGISAPQLLVDWMESFVPEGATEEQSKAIIAEKFNEKWVQYNIPGRVAVKLCDGEYALSEGTTPLGIMTKVDATSVTLHNTYCQQELNLQVTNDPDLN
jgi:hypothetical protein